MLVIELLLTNQSDIWLKSTGTVRLVFLEWALLRKLDKIDIPLNDHCGNTAEEPSVVLS